MSDYGNSADVIGSLMGDLGMTQSEIARHVGRSPDLIRLVRTGKRPGNNIRDALITLRTSGTITPDQLPPRRRRKDGKIARVRAKVGTDWTPSEQGEHRPSVVPVDPARPKGSPRTRHRFSEQRTVLPGGVRRYDVSTPKGAGAKGWGRAREALMKEVRSIARSQSQWRRIDPATGKQRGKKAIRITATMSDGKQIEVYEKGGSYASTILKGLHAHDGDARSWINGEIQRHKKRTEYEEWLARTQVVNISLTSYDSVAGKEDGTETHIRLSGMDTKNEEGKRTRRRPSILDRKTSR